MAFRSELGAVLLVLGTSLSCEPTYRRLVERPDQIAPPVNDPPVTLKVHGKNGDVVVFDSWELREETLFGPGKRYDATRKLVAIGAITVAFEDIALLETNQPKAFVHSGLVMMSVVTVAVGIPTVVCAANPKACFGSCPTFYRGGERDGPILAEGFSASVARSLEATDIDSLQGWRQAGGTATVLMRNEAFETHVVRHVDVLAVPSPAELDIVRTGETFWTATPPTRPTACTSPRGSCLADASAADGAAYQSVSDPRDLSATERLELEFPRSDAGSALVIRARNTLLNTFLFYQTLAYLGPDAGRAMAALDRARPDDKLLRRLARYRRLLGEIRVSVRTHAGRWVEVGRYGEVGPLAWEAEAIPIPEVVERKLPEAVLHVRLELTKGYWRVDSVTTTRLVDRAPAQRLSPTSVRSSGADQPSALRALLDPNATLVTYPGDEYALEYEIPAGPHVLFLASRGYYYEWIRDAWLMEHDPDAARHLLRNPRRALRKLAPAYKAIEAEADAVFWNSKVR